MTYAEVDHWLAELTHVHGVKVVHTANKSQTAAYAVSQYRWWNERQWHQHNRHDRIYAPFNPVVGGGSGGRRVGYTNRTVPKLEKMMAQLDGVDRAAYSIARKYKSMSGLVRDLWFGDGVEGLAETRVQQSGSKVEGRVVRLGGKKAASIVEQLSEGEKDS